MRVRLWLFALAAACAGTDGDSAGASDQSSRRAIADSADTAGRVMADSITVGPERMMDSMAAEGKAAMRR